MPLTPGTGERQLAFKLNELTDVQSLVDMMWQQLTGLSAASTESLRPMVRIGHRLYLLYVQHRADYAAALNAPPAYVAPTADVITGWKADDPQLKAAFEALSASNWPSFRVFATAELYCHFKCADQWLCSRSAANCHNTHAHRQQLLSGVSIPKPHRVRSRTEERLRTQN